MVWDKLTGEPLHNAISNKMTLLLRETVTSNFIPALHHPYTTPFWKAVAFAIYCILNGFISLSELGHILFCSLA